MDSIVFMILGYLEGVRLMTDDIAQAYYIKIDLFKLSLSDKIRNFANMDLMLSDSSQQVKFVAAYGCELMHGSRFARLGFYRKHSI